MRRVKKKRLTRRDANSELSLFDLFYLVDAVLIIIYHPVQYFLPLSPNLNINLPIPAISRLTTSATATHI